MPLVRYTFIIEGDTLTEEDWFERCPDARKMILEAVIEPMNVFRKELGEPLVQLESVEVTHPYQHLHSWRKTHQNLFADTAYYLCDHCRITGTKAIDKVSGGSRIGLLISRDKRFLSDKFEVCRDKLKPLPELKF